MERFISLVGLLAMVGLAWTLSTDRRRVSRRIVLTGLGLQIVVAGFILWTPPGRSRPLGDVLSRMISAGFEALQAFIQSGTRFLFGMASEVEPTGRTDQLLSSFAFGVLPTIIFFSSLTAVCYHLGILQWIVEQMARVMQKTLGVSGAESLSAAANVFVGHTEAPLVVRPYIGEMTDSELHALMVGGFATISGGLLAAYAGMGISAGHLVTASFISAPAALLIAKVLRPETAEPKTLGSVKVKVPSQGVNVIEAAATGATDGLKLAANVGAMLLAFLALIALADALVGGIGSLFGYVDKRGVPTWSLANAFGYAFAPIAWLMGVESGDCLRAGELLGLKMVANEFLAFERMGTWIGPGSDVTLSMRTQTIMTYALCGFSNFGAIGIQIGGIGGIAPERRSDLARFGIRAMLGGALACCMTGCVAGLLVSGK